MVFVGRGALEVRDGCCVVVDTNGVRTHLPLGNIACVLLEPGTSITHAAVTLAADVGCLLCWVGEGGVRHYSAGLPGGARADKLLYQARVALDDTARLKIVRNMFSLRFGEEAPKNRSVEQLRGVEGARVRSQYKLLAGKFGLVWKGRRYDPQDWQAGDQINQCLSAATACLYGVTEAAILTAGYAPCVGFLHTGKQRSFVFDIADIVKFDTVVPLAFQTAKRKGITPARDVRIACRDEFRRTKLLKKLIPLIHTTLAASGITPLPWEADPESADTT